MSDRRPKNPSRRGSIAGALVSLVTLAGCAGAQPGAVAHGGESPRRPLLERVYGTWADLVAQGGAVYIATATRVTREAPLFDWCFTDAQPVDSTSGSLPPTFCESPRQISGHMSYEREQAPVWLVTVPVGGAAQAIHATECGEQRADCREVPKDMILEGIRCHQLDDIWQDVDEGDRQCDDADDCAIVAAAGDCLRVAVARDREADYRAVLDRYGPGCRYAGMGQCAPRSDPPQCVEHVCRTAEEAAGL